MKRRANLCVSNFAYKISKSLLYIVFSNVFHIQKHIYKLKTEKMTYDRQFFIVMESSCKLENQNGTFSGYFPFSTLRKTKISTLRYYLCQIFNYFLQNNLYNKSSATPAHMCEKALQKAHRRAQRKSNNARTAIKKRSSALQSTAPSNTELP